MPLVDLSRKLTQTSPEGTRATARSMVDDEILTPNVPSVWQRIGDHIWTWTAAFAVATGVAALLCDHLQLSQAAIFDMRALFGLVAAASITAVLLEKARTCSAASGPDLYCFTRLVSRWVYILMYSLAIVRVGLYVLEADQSYVSHIAHHRIPPPRPLDDFQFYIICCLTPLWLVRSLVLAIPFDRR